MGLLSTIQTIPVDYLWSFKMADKPSCKCCKNHVNCCSCWTKETNYSWTKSMRSSPNFSPITWVNWLEKGGKKNAGDKSWEFFKEGYIHDIYIGNELNEMPSSESPKLFYCRARSYRKDDEPHYLFIGFCLQDNRASVPHAHCSCRAGSGGHCNHVLGLIFLLNDLSSSGTLDIPSDATCTSRPQSWHIYSKSSFRVSFPIYGYPLC